MAKRNRNYKQEYVTRTGKAKRLGLSTAQARGHARKSEVPISTLKKQGLVKSSNASAEKRFIKVVKTVATGQSLSTAAKKAHTTPTTVLKLNAERQLFVKDAATGKYILQGTAAFPIATADGKLFLEVPLDKANARVVGTYWNAVELALSGRDLKALKKYRNTVVHDIRGNRYRLLIDINQHRAIRDQMTQGEADNFNEKFYRSLRHAA